MWNINEIGSTNSNRKFQLLENESPVSHRRFLELLAGDQNFVVFYNSYLENCDFEAFFWENKPLTQYNLNKIYECNLVQSELLAGVKPDTQTFSSYFKSTQNVVSFPNLGGDAKLIVPCPDTNPDVYTHIGNFVRKAPKQQIMKFWKRVGSDMLNEISNKPKWLSTSGIGVFWLHVRIDTIPKYYQTEEYK